MARRLKSNKKKPDTVEQLVEAGDAAQLAREAEERAKKVAQASKCLTDSQRSNFLIKARSEALHNCPRTVQELHDCVRILYGVSIPYTSCSDYAQAPMEWFASVFFGWAPLSVVVGARGGSKTFGLAKLHHLWGTFWPGNISRHAAATREQAEVASSYLDLFSRDPVLSKPFEKGKDSVTKTQARWENGSHWKVVTGTIAGVSGQHPNKATFDEIEFWDWDAIEQTWAVPVTRGDNRKIGAYCSTRQRSYGAMCRLVEEADDKGVVKFLWTAFETMERCRSCVALDKHPHGSDDQRQNACRLWEDCHGKKGVRSTGWIPRKDVCTLKRSMNKKSWETQGLCKRPSNTGLVLHNFEHKNKPNGNYFRWVYQADLPYELWYDPSEGKRSVIYFVQHDWTTGFSYVFDELVIDDCPDASHAKQACYEMLLLRGYSDPEFVVTDPRRTDAVATWRRGTMLGEGIQHHYNAVSPDLTGISGKGQEITTTIELLRTEICDGAYVRRLYVNEYMCPRCIRATKEYHFPTDMQGNLTSETPHKAYSDEIDPIRYGVMYKKERLRSGNVRIRVL